MHISSDDNRLQYCGRIDFDDPKAPVFVYAASFVSIRFTGKSIAVKLANKRAYWSSRMGYILDGQQGQFLLASDQEPSTYVIADDLADSEHTLLLFKRMDSCHIVTFLGFELEDGASVLAPAPLSSRKMEVFGDSVSCGEVSEAVEFSDVKQWDFSRYTPNVVILAFGQNDNHPDDYMAEDYNGEKAKNWREHYQRFLEHLMQIYPKATFILTTTILEHNENWDISIEEVCQKVHSPRVHHFLYSKNGKGTPGHIRIPEAEQMSDELTAFINGLGDEIWK